MSDFIARDKMSKKAKREMDNSKRVVWQFRPTTRVKPSAKIYSRKNTRLEQE